MPDRTHRVVSGDGTILVYDFTPHPPGRRADYGFVREDFEGAILCPEKDCPDHEPWMGVSRDLGTDRCCAAVYNHGDVVCSDLANCYILWQTPGKIRRCSYLLESRGGGELLLASVLQEACGGGRLACDLSVSLHALEREGGEEPLVEWTRRDDGTSMLGDDVLFLGFPGSFAVEAARFGGEVSGGTAYFVMDNDSGGQTEEPCRVYRYSFHDGAATLVETLPPGWHDARCMWFLPDPQISPIRRGGPATSSGSSRRGSVPEGG
ncbi:hypothetical protein PAHAL_3G056200 [Panicum hallii]|uniref:KIB1-4 beta-propeller domain-containing protein n=1 Tax=Panicum hallii TaxID=206008 RepID=A0A2T8KHD0_9POAL|nr:hypothetical protein PAHAL_3G056200 [Panicum hallii]